MKIPYDVRENGLRIYAYPQGVLDMDMTLDYFERLKADTNVARGAIEIVDFKDVTDFRLSYLESQQITARYQEPKAVRTIAATIFVCESSLAFGIGRMLLVLHEMANENHKVVLVRFEKEVESVIRAL